MSFLKRFSRSLAGGNQEDPYALWVYVRCKRCGEAIGTRVSLRSDLSIRYDESGRARGYDVRKVLIGGKRRCYQPVEVRLTFDTKRRLVDREIIGGDFITAEEFAAESASE